MDMKFQVVVTAVGEVRDKDGNLISSEPINEVRTLTEAELIDAGLPVPEEK